MPAAFRRPVRCHPLPLINLLGLAATGNTAATAVFTFFFLLPLVLPVASVGGYPINTAAAFTAAGVIARTLRSGYYCFAFPFFVVPRPQAAVGVPAPAAVPPNKSLLSLALSPSRLR